MTELENSKLTPEATGTEADGAEAVSLMERVAQNIIVAYAWVAGPGMSEQDRVNRELLKSRRLEIELDTTSIVG